MNHSEAPFKVVGRKNGQSVEITDNPMTKEDCEKWIKEQKIEIYYTNVFAVPYYGNKPIIKN
jgi:hypothetical protein